ncbi:MAG: hypothetical protein KUG71_01220 [Porticoccaceae bacterium]|nr:hypothetical protein [Porticoccaceae bacterium]
MFSQFNFKEKAIAFLSHAGISLGVFAVLIILVKLIWYPDFYYKSQAIQGFLLVVFLVDVVLGPLLTFVVYKKNKPGLKFDLSLIVLLQLAVFIYGVSIVYKERPLYLVYTVDRFVVVTANLIDQDAVKFPELKNDLPRIVGTGFPEDAEERDELMWKTMDGGPDIDQVSYLYRPIIEVKTTMQEQGISVDSLPESIALEIKTRWPSKAASDIKAYPFVGSEEASDQLLVWDMENLSMLGLIDIDPWGLIEKSKG